MSLRDDVRAVLEQDDVTPRAWRSSIEAHLGCPDDAGLGEGCATLRAHAIGLGLL